MTVLRQNQSLQSHLDEARFKAWDSMARYKFMQFGYWAAIYIHLARIDGQRGSPFTDLVKLAKQHIATAERPPSLKGGEANS